MRPSGPVYIIWPADNYALTSARQEVYTLLLHPAQSAEDQATATPRILACCDLAQLQVWTENLLARNSQWEDAALAAERLAYPHSLNHDDFSGAL
jgi:hypothetical protein